MSQNTIDLLWGVLIAVCVVCIAFVMPIVIASVYDGRLTWVFCATFAGCTH